MNTKRSGLGKVSTEPSKRPKARSAAESRPGNLPVIAIAGCGGNLAGMKARYPVGRETY